MLVKQFLRWFQCCQAAYFSMFFGILDISGCLLRFGVWLLIFSVSVVLNFLGFVFLAFIWVLGQLAKIFERPQPVSRRRRPGVAHPRRLRSHDINYSKVANGHNPAMDYDNVIRTARGIYSSRGGFSRPRSSYPDSWFSPRYSEYDSCYFTDPPTRSASEASWYSSRSMVNKGFG